ncbi:HPP family protein [Kribbella sp. NPDC020789]
MLVKDLMTTPAITVTAQLSVAEALRLLDQNQITAVPVVDRKGELVGMVSEADLLADAVLLDPRVTASLSRLSMTARPRRVADLMVTPAIGLEPDDDLDRAIDLLRTTMAKSLPVSDGGHVVGVISRSDVIHHLAGRDDRIGNDLATAFSERGLDWTAQVDDGIVRIRGPVGDLDRQRAEAIAHAIPGVIAVHVVHTETGPAT